MFKDRLRDARKRCGYTQESLAEQIGVKKSTVNGYEKGNSEPDMEKVSALMKVLGVDANYLFQDEMSEENRLAFSEAATEIAINFDSLTDSGKELIVAAMTFALKHHKADL